MACPSSNNAHILKIKKLQHWQIVTICLLCYDAVAANLAYFIALWMRFDCQASVIPEYYSSAFFRFAPIYTILTLLTYAVCKLYKSMWQFASYNELLRCITATGITFVIQLIGITVFFGKMPISYYVCGVILQFLLTLGIRFSYRFILLLRSIRRNEAERSGSRVMLIGAGEAGQMILRDCMTCQESHNKICCIIDDNPNKWTRYVDGVPIVGGRDVILEKAKEYQIDKIFLAIPSASAKDKQDILNICSETGCELKQLPGLYQFVTDEVSLRSMKDVAVEDLLGREPIQINLEEVFRFIQGKKVLVTGGGGSIGSELCRQIAAHHPKQLIIFDVYENNAYDIQLELRDQYPDLDLVTLIGSVRDSRKMDMLFSQYRPDIVYHAAAHKHVPLMEDSACESIKNNVIGTYKTAYAAMMHGCQRFVLISTDKAVNPTNIMGASKRLCEMIVQAFDRKIREGKAYEMPHLSMHMDDEFGNISQFEASHEVKTEFVAVRFGNVLGSNGSVIPLFKRQIANGGPVTVTHPDIIRYFMTIPEAVSLVLQAGVYAQGGDIFVLDMGSPVRIDTLARNLIKLSGYKPDVDIKIEYTGLRPGEKLFEEKLMAEEGMRKTPNELIHIGSPIPFEVDMFLEQLEELMEAAYANREDIREWVQEIVPTYHPAGENGSENKGETYEKLVKEAALTTA